MAHISLYRKWRPQTFDDVVGQERVTRTLRNAVAAGRVAHAYLFSGHRGTGKTTTARILAKALNCEQGPTPDPCNVCEQCRSIGDGYSLDVIELDAASNRGIDEIREIREKVRLSPAAGRYKVYILDEAHMLTTEAENALLKTLEEPPSHVVFVLVTTEPHRLPPTILSRCQRFEFRRIPTATIAGRLSRIAAGEGIPAQPSALYRIAQSADGALRDAESLLDQIAGTIDGEITDDAVVRLLGTPDDEMLDMVTCAVRDGDVASALRIASEVADSGQDVRQVLRRLVGHFRDLLILRTVPDGRDLVDVTDERYERLRDDAQAYSAEEILRVISVLSAAESEARWTTQARLSLEMALLRLARPDLDPTLEGLRGRILRLEQQVRGQSPAMTDPQMQAPEPTPADRSPADAATYRPAPTLLPLETISLSIEQVVSHWPRVLEEIKQRRVYTYALVADARPHEIRGDMLTLHLPVGSDFAAETLRDPRHRTLIEEACRIALGTPVRVHFVLEQNPGIQNATPRPDRRMRDPLVEQATHLLGPAVSFRSFDTPEQ
ncbi:MAG: DNA polymerase III subunit gamma/tau [Armatimonadota bacterium]|nr:DNA polymerase III subunit gamma/tau [Armatimonadota bacterium]